MPLPRAQADDFFKGPAAEKHDATAAGPSTSDPKTSIPDFAENLNAPVPGWPLLAKVMGIILHSRSSQLSAI
jgi:hypothetical protein